MPKYDPNFRETQRTYCFDDPSNPRIGYDAEERLVDRILAVDGVSQVWFNHQCGLVVYFESEEQVEAVVKEVSTLIKRAAGRARATETRRANKLKNKS